MGPLQGIRIVEMGGLAPGPFCAMMLADMGAQVLRVERPDNKPRSEPRFLLLNRNRRGISVDIKSSEGAALMQRLIANSDALIEGYRPGVMERLGLGPAECMAANPQLVYGRMTGWGQDGPLAAMSGHDLNYIALAGALESLGARDSAPSVPLNLIGDFGGGGMMLAFGIACALVERASSGKGQVIDAAMVDGASLMMTYMHGKLAAGQWGPRGTNSMNATEAPYYGVYETSDGLYVSVGPSEQKFHDRLLGLLGLQGDAGNPARRNPATWPEPRARMEQLFRTKTRKEWCDMLEQADVCFAPVLSMQEAPMHPHHRERGSFVEVDGIVQPAPAPRFGRTPAGKPVAAIEPGTDLAAALAPWGVSAQEARVLADAGIAS